MGYGKRERGTRDSAGGHRERGYASYGAVRRPEPLGEGITKALVRALGGPRDVPVGSNQDGLGSGDRAEHREIPYTRVASVDPANSVRPWRDVERPGVAEVDEDRSAIVQQSEHAPRTPLGDEIEIGHSTPEQRVSLTEVEKSRGRTGPGFAAKTSGRC